MIYLHYEKKIMHLDIKMENILVTAAFNMKISDFGHARTYEDVENLKNPFSYGTEWWSPPEYDEFSKFSG